MVGRRWIESHAAQRCRIVATVLSLLVCAVGSLIPGIVFASTSVSGRISTNATWTLSGNPYIVTSSVQVYGATTSPITLTLEPGVIVKFQTGTSLTLGVGSSPAILSAAGTDSLPIIFTSVKDDTAGGDTNGDGAITSPAPGDWSYINLIPGSSASLLDHVEVRYGGSSQGSLYIREASPTIQNSVITHSSNAGILIVTQTVTSAPTILNNRIEQSGTYGISTQGTLTPVGGLIQGNTILSSGQYGLYLANAISAAIRDNQIVKGLYFTSQFGSATLTGNQITELGSVVTQIPARLIEMFQTQNTLEGITPATSLYVIADTITGSTTLTTMWNSYVVNSGQINVDGTVANPARLIVQAGVRVLFGVSSGISVGTSATTPGVLQVLGTTAAPVLFTRATAQGWSGIALNGATVGAQTVVQNVRIDYGNTSTSPTSASLRISCTSPTLSNVTVRFSGPSGIALFNASPVMTGLTIQQVGADGVSINDSGTCSGFTTPSAPVISQATISQAGRYGVYMAGGTTTTPTLQNSAIQTPVGYGLYIVGARPTILNNTIDGSIYISSQLGLATVTGNTINHFNTKTGRLPAALVQAVQAQNTLNDIDPTTVLELEGNPVVSVNTTLGLRWTQYRLMAGVITVSGSPVPVLTILPGVTMRFSAGLYLNIGGAQPGILLARGTASAPILLATLSAAPNNWRGLYFSNTAVPGASVLDYVTVDQAGSVDAAVRALSTALTMTHCIIRNSSRHGIELSASSLTMQYCQVINNALNGLLVDNAATSFVTIANSDLFNNAQGAIVNNQPSTPVDARTTWWGDASGPGGSGPGGGNSVGAQVLYDPWLGTSFTAPFAITHAYPSSAALTQGGGETTLTGDLTQTGDWTVQITDAADTVLKSATGSGRLITAPWDGTDPSGTAQPNGTYFYRIDATAATVAAPVIGRLQLNSSLPIAIITQPAADQLILTPSVAIVGTAAGPNFSAYSLDLGLGTSPQQFIAIRSGATAPVTNGTLATWTLQPSIPSNSYQIRLRVTGAGGTAEATRLVTIDHSPPLPPELTTLPVPITAQPIIVTGTAEANTTVELYVNETSAGQTTASEDGEFTFQNIALTLGTNSLKARATDAANNIGGFSADQPVVYLPPDGHVIEILSPADGSTVYK